MTTNPIKPTRGRMVLFICADGDTHQFGSSECAAVVTGVKDDNTVNLTVFPDGEHTQGTISVPDVPYYEADDFAKAVAAPDPAEGEEAPVKPRWGWHWMDYQKQIASGQREATQHANAPTGGVDRDYVDSAVSEAFKNAVDQVGVQTKGFMDGVGSQLEQVSGHAALLKEHGLKLEEHGRRLDDHETAITALQPKGDATAPTEGEAKTEA